MLHQFYHYLKPNIGLATAVLLSLSVLPTYAHPAFPMSHQRLITSNSPQNLNITGEVKDDQDQAISDVIITIKESKEGVVTDKNGKFVLNNIPAGSFIILAHVRYDSLETQIKNGITAYKFTLKPAVNFLHEIVVLGFGSNTIQNKTSRYTTHPTSLIQLPEYPGGISELYKYLGKSTNYPKEASDANVSGKIVVSFIVNEYGAIRRAEIKERLGYGIEEEVLRVVLNMDRWNPALQNGKPVAMEFKLPLHFDLELLDTTETETKQQNDPPKRLRKQEHFETEDYQELSGTLTISDLGDFLVIVNGITMENRGQKAFQALDQDTIKSIMVLKGEEASLIYEESGNNGVILIQTKSFKAGNK